MNIINTGTGKMQNVHIVQNVHMVLYANRT